MESIDIEILDIFDIDLDTLIPLDIDLTTLDDIIVISQENVGMKKGKNKTYKQYQSIANTMFYYRGYTLFLRKN